MIDRSATYPDVVVTGVGVKTPAGNTVDAFWSEVRHGRSAIQTVEDFDTSNLPVRIAGQVRNFDPGDYLGVKQVRWNDRATHLGFAAAMDALADSAPTVDDPARGAVIVGTGMGGSASFVAQSQLFAQRGPDRVSPHAITMIMPNTTAALVAIHTGWCGPNLCIATACASATNAIGEAFRLIREGAADIAIAGGTESSVNEFAIAAFARMGVLSRRNDQPARASRPFDRGRDGFALAEGAAFIVLERRDFAMSRGARIYGQLRGYGRNSDAFHLTASSNEGVGAASCMRLALRDADVAPSAITHIHAHGTATTLNDRTEAAAIVEVFGRSAPPVTSSKGVTGHLLGAAGAVQVVASLLALRDGVAPPTANFEDADQDIAIDVVSGAARPIAKGAVLINTFGFGGHNASLVFGPDCPPGPGGNDRTEAPR